LGGTLVRTAPLRSARTAVAMLVKIIVKILLSPGFAAAWMPLALQA
jgi:hypothetical protein